MNKFNRATNNGDSAALTVYDEGLRRYFLKIYSLMSTGLAVTTVAAFVIFSIPELTSLIFNITPNGDLLGMTGSGIMISFAPLAISIYFAFGFDKISVENARILFWVYAALIGISLASLGFVYTGASVTKTFIICAGMFGGMSLYGYTTHKDLSSFGSFLLMGLWGLILASVINIFFESAAAEFTMSVIGVFIFIGLIAYDTQKLKALYFNGVNNEKLAIVAAFTLYLDFINLFIYLLRFLGVRKRHNK